MRIQGTTAPITAKAAPAPEKKGQITIKVPDVDAVSIADTTWKAIDGFGSFAARTGGAALVGVGNAIPIYGLALSRCAQGNLSNKPGLGNGVNNISNALSGLGQVVGLGSAALSLGSWATGIGPSGALFQAAVGGFAAAGLAGIVTGYATTQPGLYDGF